MLSYKDIYELDIRLWNCLKEDCSSDEKLWNSFYDSYKDPDGYPLENGNYKCRNNIVCTADGLLSIKRIKYFEGIGNNFIDVFKNYRKTPIIFFPRERGGINGLRATLLEDRIDHTLLDLKMYCGSKKSCKENIACILASAYNQPQTKKWLESFNYDFCKIVKWLDIEDIFVDKDLNIFNLEKDEDMILDKLKETYIHPKNPNYFSSWSSKYYDNVKKKIKEYEDKRCM